MLLAASNERVAWLRSTPRSSGSATRPVAAHALRRGRIVPQADRRHAGNRRDHRLALFQRLAPCTGRRCLLRSARGSRRRRRSSPAPAACRTPSPPAPRRATRRRSACRRPGRSRPSAPPASGRAPAGCRSAACRARPAVEWRRPPGSWPMFGAPPKPDRRPRVTVDEWPSPSICRVEPMNRSTAYWPASWQSMRFERIEPSAPVKNTSGRAAM